MEPPRCSGEKASRREHMNCFRNTRNSKKQKIFRFSFALMKNGFIL